MNATTSIVPQDIARYLERAKIETELLQKYASELKTASWWKAFRLRLHIRREVDRICWEKRKADILRRRTIKL